MTDDNSAGLRPKPSDQRDSATTNLKSGDSFTALGVGQGASRSLPQHWHKPVFRRPIDNGLDDFLDDFVDGLYTTPEPNTEESETEFLDSEVPGQIWESGSSDLEVEGGIKANPRPSSENIVVALPDSALSNPRSLYDGFVPPANVMKESRAVAALLEALNQDNAHLSFEDFVEFDLSDFTVYLDSVKYPNELRPLQHLATRAASDKFYFDGTLSFKGKSFFLQKVPFRELPVGNYGVSEDTVGDQIWIRSELNRDQEIYYRLGQPSLEYERFHKPFVWIANLAKHVVDYCHCIHEKKRRVKLYDFKSQFSIFLFNRHARSASFQSWSSAHGETDFRGALISNIDYIWKEAVGVLGRKNASWHYFWKEIGGTYYKHNLKPPIASLTTDDESEFASPVKNAHSQTKEHVAETIVTPYIHDLFGHMGFENIMKVVSPVEETRHKQTRQINDTRPPEVAFCRRAGRTANERGFIESLKPGDVISTPPDDEGTDTMWKRECSAHHDSDYVWYALVQKVHIEKGRRSFDVLWMYQPRDTPCALMKYPWAKELFLSDSCTCGGRRLDENDILDAHTIDWFGKPSPSTSNFFVRQTYVADERCWVALKQDHMTCQHQLLPRRSDHAYRIGDTVLAQTNRSHLDVFVIESISDPGRRQQVTVRKLLRRKEVDLEFGSDCAANELIYSNQLFEIDIAKIVRLCLVRVFGLDEAIPAPYNRNGTGDAFFITHQEVINVDYTQYLPVEDPESLKFRRGFDQTRTPPSEKLRGLDLFCGGGNFGRGLEDGGAIEMKWANDISSNAIHTYMANCKPTTCTPYLGSIDDLLYRALNGMADVPQPGDVQFVSGGSPCQGFSRLTADQTTEKQRKNRSLVASFASFIDLYRPQYGLLENVMSIVQTATAEKRAKCFFSQLICSIVGLGYQVRIVYADAWSFGCPQSRSRLFLSFAAPGVPLPKAPIPSHSNPPRTKMGKVGIMSSGQPFGERFDLPTPFKFVSASEAVGDLPNIQDGKADYCIAFPDHRLSIGYTPVMRAQMRHIPTFPWGMNFDKAYFGYRDDEGQRVPGTISDADRAHLFPKPTLRGQRVQKGSKGWGRVHPNRLFSTVTTNCSMTDSRIGTVSHWEQPRPMTILEARRAQGFLDHELLTGKPAEQWHIVGNSVARPVALALGLTIREAWLGSLHDQATRQPILERTKFSDAVPGHADAEMFDTSADSATDVRYGDIFSDAFRDDISASTPTTSTDTGSNEWESGVFNKRKRSSTNLYRIKAPSKRARLFVDST